MIESKQKAFCCFEILTWPWTNLTSSLLSSQVFMKRNFFFGSTDKGPAMDLSALSCI